MTLWRIFNCSLRKSEYHAFLIGAAVLLLGGLHRLATSAVRSAVAGFLNGFTVDRPRFIHVRLVILGPSQFIHVVGAWLVYHIFAILLKIACKLWIVRTALILLFLLWRSWLGLVEAPDHIHIHAVSHLDERYTGIFTALLVCHVHGICIRVGS